jgi:transcriptional regulator of met regulon
MFGFLGIEAGLTGGKLALAIFKKLWWSLPIIILAIALGLTRHTLANTKHDLGASRQETANERAAHAITKQSLAECNQKVVDNNARIKAAADTLAREQGEAAANEAHNAKLAQSTDAEIAALRARASQPRKPCTLSDEAKRELEGS